MPIGGCKKIFVCHRYLTLHVQKFRVEKISALPHSSTPNCHWPPGWDIAGERARPGLGMGSTAAPGCRVRRPRRTPFRPPARCFQRGRWQPHAEARALPPFVHPKLPLAARLGHCWGARPSRWPFSASRRGRTRHSVRAVFMNQNASVGNRRRARDYPPYRRPNGTTRQ
jgi:hypothetical protein